MTKKERRQATQVATGRQAFAFFGDVKAEFKKISWTTKDELKVYTKIVVASTFVFGMMIYLADLIVNGSLRGIGVLFKWIVG